MSIVLNEV